MTALSTLATTKLKKTLDPILSLQVSHPDSDSGTSTQRILTSENGKCLAASVTSLCFFNPPRQTTDVISESDDDSDSDSDGELQCGRLLRGEKTHNGDVSARAREVFASSSSLCGRVLGTCHSNGGCFLWDLSSRKVVQDICGNRGPGLTLRRVDDVGSDSRFIYQTRDPEGTVSLFDLQASSAGAAQAKVIAAFETHSRTFCAAAPCKGNSNLVVMPCEECSIAVVRDWRVPSGHHPAALFHSVEGIGRGLEQSFSTPDQARQYGMLTSLAMADSNGTTTIACGMENGTLVFHNMAVLTGTRSNMAAKNSQCRLSLCGEPILSLDLAPSTSNQKTMSDNTAQPSVVAIAGMAGCAEDLAELPKSERGRVAVIKTKSVGPDGHMEARVRARLSTCDETILGTAGKPGVAQSRFRPDGRIFAVGGWDKRIRIFDRSAAAAPLAILRGHAESVNALDWSSDAAVSGLLATGSSDGQIRIWQCFPSTA